MYPGGQIAPLILCVPVIDLSCAALILGETITDGQLIGIAMVMVGLIVNIKGAQLIGWILKTRQ